MKILIAGATGVLGRVTVKRLLEHGHEVIALARSAESSQALKAQGAQPFMADVLDAQSLTRVIHGAARGVEAVLHLATVIPRDASMPGAWLPNNRVRVDGTRNLIDLARKIGAVHYIQQGITRLYADHGESWITEDSPLADPQPAHLESTVTMEKLVRAASGLQRVILRGGQFYGAGTSTTERLLNAARSGTLRLDGDGRHFISLIQPEDMAQAVELALSTRGDLHVFNVVDNTPLTQKDFFMAIAALANPSCTIQGNDGAKRIPSRRCSNAKLSAIGFTPKYPSHMEGLKDAHARMA
ncbi:2-alkyl-3-oxoalkanoate reductase [Castellaniella defragrans]